MSTIDNHDSITFAFEPILIAKILLRFSVSFSRNSKQPVPCCFRTVVFNVAYMVDRG